MGARGGGGIKWNIYRNRDGTIKTTKEFLCGFVIVIHLQISGQEAAIRSEKWCCGYLPHLRLAWGCTAYRRIADVYVCPLACVTQISIYENSAWNVAAVYRRRIWSNSVKPQAGWKTPSVWTDSKWRYGHKAWVEVVEVEVEDEWSLIINVTYLTSIWDTKVKIVIIKITIIILFSIESKNYFILFVFCWLYFALKQLTRF